MNKIVANCLVLFFAGILALLLVQEILTVVQKVSQVLSSVEFTEVKNGVYESSIFGIVIKTVQHLRPLLLDEYCKCSVKSFKIEGTSKPCKSISAPIPNNPIFMKETMINSSHFYVTLIEGPMNFERGEILHVSCYFPAPNTLGTAIYPLNFDRGVKLLSDVKSAALFFDKYLKTRPQTILSGGQKILFKLHSVFLQEKDGKGSSLGRYINSHITATSSGDDRFTEVILSWDTPLYILVKRFKLGNYLQVANLFATFFLSVELVYAIYGRFTKDKLITTPQANVHDEDFRTSFSSTH